MAYIIALGCYPIGKRISIIMLLCGFVVEWFSVVLYDTARKVCALGHYIYTTIHKKNMHYIDMRDAFLHSGSQEKFCLLSPIAGHDAIMNDLCSQIV